MSASPMLGVERGPSGRAEKDRGLAAAALACEHDWCGTNTVPPPAARPIMLQRGVRISFAVCSWHCASRVALKQELAGGDA